MVKITDARDEQGDLPNLSEIYRGGMAKKKDPPGHLSATRKARWHSGNWVAWFVITKRVFAFSGVPIWVSDRAS